MNIDQVRARVNVRAADAALAVVPVPLRVLDIGCGDGSLVRELVARLPNALEIVGVDPDEEMIDVARSVTEGFPTFMRAAPEQLPFPDAHFDLAVTALSFAGWRDQYGGLKEACRVLAPGGAMVVAELTSGSASKRLDAPPALSPKVLLQLFADVGFRPGRREVVYRRWGLFAVARVFIAYR